MDVHTIWLENYTCTIQNCINCISTVIVNLCYTNIYYIYMYMNIKWSFSMCLNKIKSWTNEDGVTVQKLQMTQTDSYWLWMYPCFLQRPHPPDSNAASSAVWQIVLWPMRRQTLSSLRFWKRDFSDGVFKLFIIYWWIDFSSRFICTCKWKSFLVLSIDAEKCNCRKIYNIYDVFRMHFADTICTYYLRYSFYEQKNISV